MTPGMLPRPVPGVLDGWDSMTQAERDAAYNNTAAVAEVASLHDRLLQLSCRADQQRGAERLSLPYDGSLAPGAPATQDRMTWARMAKIAADWLPKPRILHPWPSKRFAVKNPRWEPCAGIPLARIYAGGAQ